MLARPHHPLHWDKISPDPFTFSDVTGSSHQPQKVNSKEVQKGGGSSEERARVSAWWRGGQEGYLLHTSPAPL